MESFHPFIRKVEYLGKGEIVRAYVFVREKTEAIAEFDGKTYKETSNLREPYDWRLHTFDFPAAELAQKKDYTVVIRLHGKRKSDFFSDEITELKIDIAYDETQLVPLETAISRTERGIRKKETVAHGNAGGAEWADELYGTPDGAPIHVFSLIADPKKVDVIAGTPHAEPIFTPNDIQTVMDEALAAEAKGRRVLAATNADFFDMFGDGHPSGICVSGGILVANADSPDPFFGITKDGKAVVEYPEGFDITTLKEAVAGGQIIVADGKIADTAPLEGFGDIAHPRTAFGVDKEGKVIVMVVDGRRPTWSNGAALTELAKLMIEKGATRALNADGGGSSTFIVRKDNGLEMINHPADLEKPMEDLIRPLFNSLLIAEKS